MVEQAYRPPFQLTSDMLLVVAFVPTAGMRLSFPGVPFVSLLGRTPVVAWFSRITESCYHDASGQRQCERDTSALGIYCELNLVALSRQRALFVPEIYASEARTVEIGRHYYGMPKRLHECQVRFGERHVRAQCVGEIDARVLGKGRTLAKLADRLWPRRTWPARFPSGGEVRPMILATPHVQVAFVRGSVDIGGRNVTLLPIGLVARGLRMELP